MFTDTRGISLADIPDVAVGKQAEVVLPDAAYRVVEPVIIHADTGIVLEVYERYAPDIAGTEIREKIAEIPLPQPAVAAFSTHTGRAADTLANWSVLGQEDYSAVRIRVGDTIVPVPVSAAGGDVRLGAVMVRAGAVPVSVLIRDGEHDNPAASFTRTDPANCFSDAIEGYQHTAGYEGGFTLGSVNGSTCAAVGLDALATHAEVRLEYAASSKDSETDLPAPGMSSKPSVTSAIMGIPKPNLLSVCLSGSGDASCRNIHQMMQLDSEGTILIPSEYGSGSLERFRIALVPVGKEQQSVTVRRMTVDTYASVLDTQVAVSGLPGTYAVTLVSGQPLVRMPFVLSRWAYYGSPHDGYFLSNRPCEQQGGYRTVRRSGTGWISYLEGCYAEYSVLLPFDSTFPKLWAVSYEAMAGKYPKLMLGDAFSHYVDEYASEFEGYPTVPGQLRFSAPQRWYRPYGKDTVRNILEHPMNAWASVIVSADAPLTDTREKLFTIHQDSPNTGILRLNSMIVTAMPPSWEGMTLRVGSPERRYAPDTVMETQRIIPSLVLVKSAGKVTGERLLVQRDAYDADWRAYPSVAALVTGVGGVAPMRCDGLFLCYRLDNPSDTWLLFYTPERLATIGWAMTLATVFAVFLYRRKRLRISV